MKLYVHTDLTLDRVAILCVNSPKLEIKPISSNKGIDKQIVVYPQWKTVSNEKEQTPVSPNNAGQCQNQCGTKAGQREVRKGGENLLLNFRKLK